MKLSICNSVNYCNECSNCGAAKIHYNNLCEPCPFNKNAKCLSEGDYVNYIPFKNCDKSQYEYGRIKSIQSSEFVFVVYNCNNDWDNYQNYTGQRTAIKDLILTTNKFKLNIGDYFFTYDDTYDDDDDPITILRIDKIISINNDETIISLKQNYPKLYINSCNKIPKVFSNIELDEKGRLINITYNNFTYTLNKKDKLGFTIKNIEIQSTINGYLINTH